ncbi:MAG: hypothetical protein ABJB74_15405 [Gemmatimonas sp.]
MIRTAAIAFLVTVFLAWMTYVFTRTGNGPGFKWDMVANNCNFTFAIVGVLYLLFFLITGVTLYFTQIRGGSVDALNILGPAFIRLLLVFVVAVPVGALLGEVYAYTEERSFLHETEQFLATAKPEPITGDMPLYSRKRWWPGSQQQLVSPVPK